MSKDNIKIIQIDTDPAVKSLKDLRKELKEYKDQMTNLEEGSDAFLEIANKAGEVKHQIEEINESIKGASADFGDMVGNVSNVAAGLTGAFEAVAGGLQAMGVESEAVDETIKRMQGLMAVVQGLSAIDDGVKAMDKLAASITSTTKAAKLLKVALQPKVFLAITAAIAALTAAWKLWGDSIKEALPFLGKTSKQLEAEKKAAEESEAAKKKQAEAEESYRKKIGSAIQGTLSYYKLLQAQYKRLQTDYQKMQWIKKNKDEFDKLGISVKNLKEAEDKFVNNTDAVVKALIKRAMATAKQQQLSELASQYTEAKVKAEKEYEKKKVSAGSRVPGTSHSAGSYEYVDRNGKWVYTEEGANKVNEKLRKQLNAEADLFYQQMNELAAEIADEMTIDTILQGINNGVNGGTDGTAKKIVDETKDKALGLVEFTDEDLQAGLKRVKQLYEERYNIQLEQLKRSDKTEKELIEGEIEIEKQRLTLYEEGTLEHEKQLTKLFELEKELSELTTETVEVTTNQYESMRKAGDVFFDGLKQTVTAFGDSSLGLSSKWIDSLDQFQLAFKQTMDIVSSEGKAGWQSYGQVAATALGGIGTLLNAISQDQDVSTKKGFEQQKKLQIAATTMNMLAGIMAAWTSSMALPAPTSFIVGAVQTAATAALGGVQIAKIKSQTLNSATASGAINPTAVNSMVIPPVQYSSAVQGASTEGAIKDTKVYVTESDIASTMNKVSVQETENTY